VISSADPKSSLLGLLGPEHLDTSFVRRVHHLRTRGLAAKLHLALDGLPQFGGLPAPQATVRGCSSRLGSITSSALSITASTANIPALRRWS
jgi:hypothetical protein